MTIGRGVSVRVAAHAAARVGEGPVWDPHTGQLHWVDILAGSVHSTDLTTGTTVTRTTPTLVGAAVPRQRGGFVAATREGFAVVGEDGELEPRLDVLSPGHRFNDAKCDARGRLWAGSTDMELASGAGALHVLEPDWTSRVVLEGLTLPNGLGWSPDGGIFYLVDSHEHSLTAHAFDLATGSLSSARRLHDFDPGVGVPDGLAVDAVGRIWVACWGGSAVRCFDQDGRELGSLCMPVRQPSSCAFAGPDLATLAVTSAREGLDLPEAAMDGSVFAIEGLSIDGAPVRGLPTHVFAG